MKPDVAVCYVTDSYYLLPSLISAGALRQFISSSEAECFIFTIGVDDCTNKRVAETVASQEIKIIPMDVSVFGAFDQAKLQETKTPLATFGRLFMETYLPGHIRRLVYLDGDVLCVDDPAPLIKAIVPEGGLAAVDDVIWYRQRMGIGGTAAGIKRYMRDLGLDPRGGYFNAGVMAAQRSTWKLIAADAYRFFAQNPHLCRHFDQSALNAVVGNGRVRLSIKWNFQTRMKVWGAERRLKPRIVHLAGYPKPWMAKCEPWPSLYEVYKCKEQSLASSELKLDSMSGSEASAFDARFQNTYGYLRRPLASWLALELMGFESVERKSWI